MSSSTVPPKVVLTHAPNDETLESIWDVLSASAEIVNLPDLPPERRADTIRSARAVLGWLPSAELSTDEFDLLRDGTLVQLLSAGADRVPFELLSSGVRVAANVGAYAEPMAEHAVAMALALAKRLPQKHAELARGVFEQLPMNRRIDGSVCGILGFGGIGKETGRRMAALGSRLHAINTSGRTHGSVEFCGTLADLDRVLAASDFVIVALPLTRATDGLLGARELACMKPDAILVNVARGAIVDQAALYEHLRDNEAFSAAVDTWWVEPLVDGEFRVDHPFFELPNLLGSPHNSGFVPGIDVVAARRAAENVLRFLRGEEPHGVVDPNDYLP